MIPRNLKVIPQRQQGHFWYQIPFVECLLRSLKYVFQFVHSSLPTGGVVSLSLFPPLDFNTSYLVFLHVQCFNRINHIQSSPISHLTSQCRTEEKSFYANEQQTWEMIFCTSTGILCLIIEWVVKLLCKDLCENVHQVNYHIN